MQVVITAVSVFLAGEGVTTQTIIAQIVIVVCIAAHFRMRPYEETVLDRLEMGALLVAFATLTGGVMLQLRTYSEENEMTEEGAGDVRKVILTVVVIALNCVYLLVWIRYYWMSMKGRLTTAKDRVVTGIQTIGQQIRQARRVLRGESEIEMSGGIAGCDTVNPLFSVQHSEHSKVAMDELRECVAKKSLDGKIRQTQECEEWQEEYDEFGKGYWWNEVTGESVWVEDC